MIRVFIVGSVGLALFAGCEAAERATDDGSVALRSPSEPAALTSAAGRDDPTQDGDEREARSEQRPGRDDGAAPASTSDGEPSATAAHVSVNSALTSGEANTRAVAFADVDGDGRTDVYLCNYREPNALYWNEGDGVLAAAEEGPAVKAVDLSLDATWGDMDGDGDLDLYVANADGQRNRLYRNLGGRRGLERVTKGHAVLARRDSYAAEWADLDGDGDRDLVVVNRRENNDLYRNDGRGGLTRETTGRVVSEGGPSRDVAIGDLDGDGDLDMVVANTDDEPNFVYVNQGGSQGGTAGAFLRLRGDPSVTYGGKTGGCALGDVDGDGDLDLALANRKGDANALFVNEGAATFVELVDSAPAADTGNSEKCGFEDVDGDGDLDLFVVNRRQPAFLYENVGGGALEKVVAGDLVGESLEAMDFGFAMLRDDGWMDLVVGCAATPNRHVRFRPAR